MPKKTVEEIAAERGIRPVDDQALEELIGKGSDLWDSDEEFEEFLNGIYERRREARNTEAQSGAA